MTEAGLALVCRAWKWGTPGQKSRGTAPEVQSEGTTEPDDRAVFPSSSSSDVPGPTPAPSDSRTPCRGRSGPDHPSPLAPEPGLLSLHCG